MKKTLLIFCLAAGLFSITGITSAQKQMKTISMLTQDEAAGNIFLSENNLRASSGVSALKKNSFTKGISPVIMGCDTLKTTFVGGNGNAGNMFDITALSSIVINAFEGNITGNGNIEIYYKTGTFVGSEATAAAWTLIGSTMVTSAGTGVPTPINIPINVSISAGQTCGFYFTGNNTGATVAYTNGTTQGAVFASNAALQIKEGVGKAYPFGTTNTPRVWNGIVHYCDSGIVPPPSAMFTGDTLIRCVGGRVTFHDLSAFNPTSWSWSFPGGNPSASTVQNPVVTYTASGTYNAKLVVSNANGNDTLTRTNYVQVLNNIGYAPVTEDFEAAPFPSASFYLFDDGSDGKTWMRDTLASGFGVGAASVYFDNYSANVTGTHDIFRTKPIDFSASSSTPSMTFDVAYSPFDTSAAIGESDTLAIYASTNCGKTFSLLYLKGGTKLSADSSTSTTSFIPTSSQWRKDSVGLASLSGKSDVIFSFENRAHFGNVLYIDNINILTGASAGVSEQENVFDIVVSPNPMSQQSIISIRNTHINKNETVLLNVYELTGRLIKTLKSASSSQGRWTAELNRENLAAGMYFIQISEGGKNAGTAKLVIE